MSKFFIFIYQWFSRHRAIFWASMLGSLAVLLVMAGRIRFEENITSFFPASHDTANMADVFSNLKVNDKVIMMFSDSTDSDDAVIEASECFGNVLKANDKHGQIEKYIGSVGQEDALGTMAFMMEHLPCLLEDEDYDEFLKLDSPEAVDSLICSDYLRLISPAGIAMKDYILQDPLGLSGNVMARTAGLNPASDYLIRSGHVFTPNGGTMLTFIEPKFSSGETGRNDKLVSLIDMAVDSLSQKFPDVAVHYFGGPVMSVYNARQIKTDTYSTSFVAIIIIVLFILAVFKRKRSIFLILCPVIYGAVFALAMAWLIQGSISGIAVGAGAAILGIALSYSIHLLAHQNHVRTVPQLLEELCSPLVIGSITTIGAFVGLLFTSSRLLQDFGLFAALTLLGTMIFCLLFLPQFLSGQEDLREGRVLSLIEKMSAYPFDKNKWLIAALVLLTAVCTYMSTKVGFDSDMMDLTYWEPKLKDAEQILTTETDQGTKSVMFVSVGATQEEAFRHHVETAEKLDSLQDAGLINGYVNGSPFICSEAGQSRRIAKWKEFWTLERIANVTASVRSAAVKYGFREDTFDGALQRLAADCVPTDFFAEENLPELLANFVGSSDLQKMLISHVSINKSNLDKVYGLFSQDRDVVIFDQGYFAGKAAAGISSDFYLILFISSFLIFFVLWISYGRLELALLSFLPMAVSWLIITGIMGILGVQFNIVNIILSTFIFGMGDDFSIFILEGLLYKYKTGRKMLDSHKTAIFFSSFTMIVGIGALVFARHPALHSIAVITILGMIAVVLIAYTAEPVIFDALVSRPAAKGRPPFTFKALVRDMLYYIPPIVGSVIIVLLSFVLLIVPMRRNAKQTAIAWLLHRACRWFVGLGWFIKSQRIGPDGGKIRAWNGGAGVIAANHQSSLDIVLILATFPKVKFMVADWVLKSPCFGALTRFLGYYSRTEGYNVSLDRLKKDIAEGWCLAVFPEGTRSLDGRIKRFHKGAFYLACEVGAPVIPLVFYGNWRICPKNQGLNMMSGVSITKILEPIRTENAEYHQLTSDVCGIVKAEYESLCAEWDSPKNIWFRRALESAYIYKGPAVEWYVRVKTGMEHCYGFFHNVLQRSGRITDLGCGMGQLDYVLSMYCPERQVTGIDYDEEKISIAENVYLHRNLPNLKFIAADASACELPESDAFVISDMLHYLDAETQENLLRRCAEKLSDGGIILVRDSNTENSDGQKVTALTEFLSTKVFCFNKVERRLCFISETGMREIAASIGLTFDGCRNDGLTSNMFYILKKS